MSAQNRRHRLFGWGRKNKKNRRDKQRQKQVAQRMVGLEALEPRQLLATFNPASVGDLIADINTANASTQDDTIDLGGGTFTLTAVDNTTDGDNGLPSIVDMATAGTLTITNGTIERSTAGGTPDFRILRVGSGADLTLDGVTVQGGDIVGGGFGSAGWGGGVLVQGGNLSVISGSIISGNNAYGGGGIATYNGGSVNVTDSTVDGNYGYFLGGGILT